MKALFAAGGLLALLLTACAPSTEEMMAAEEKKAAEGLQSWCRDYVEVYRSKPNPKIAVGIWTGTSVNCSYASAPASTLDALIDAAFYQCYREGNENCTIEYINDDLGVRWTKLEEVQSLEEAARQRALAYIALQEEEARKAEEAAEEKRRTANVPELLYLYCVGRPDEDRNKQVYDTYLIDVANGYLKEHADELVPIGSSGLEMSDDMFEIVFYHDDPNVTDGAKINRKTGDWVSWFIYAAGEYTGSGSTYRTRGKCEPRQAPTQKF